MKRFFIAAAALIISAFCASAQQMQMLPNDPAVRKGTLDNGMTYYIRHNEKPAQRAEFYLATNVGAIQENPAQDGLAHFLEHMCFNGTKNFPGKGILDYLQSIGASFGGNVNASTGVEQTIYMLNNIPLVNDEVVDKCILIMHDYSHFVTCDPQEIDNERGVILEEKRSRNDASWRMREKSGHFYYGDTKYANCSIIGSEENLKTFKPETLVDFYHTWYRPDNQALIVVGDIDVDEVEAKIKSIFADIPAPVNPKEKDVIKIPDNEEPIIGIVTDPEAPSSSMLALWKSEPMPEVLNATPQGLMIDLLKSLISNVMSERFTDITAKPDAPFLAADFGFGKMCETMEAAIGQVNFKEGEALSAYEAFLTEIEKMKRFGFAEDEVERAKADILVSYENAVKRADSRQNAEFVYPLIYNFFDSEAYMTPQDKFEIVNMILPQLNAQVLSAVAQQLITKENFVTIYQAPEKEGVSHPSEADIKAVIEKVAAADIKPADVQEIASEFVNPAKIKAGKVKKSAVVEFGATEWILKNGVRVLLLPTDHQKNSISISLSKDGGLSLVEDEDMPSFESNIWGLYQANTGVSSFPATTVTKMLAGKSVNVNPFISSDSHGVSASASPKDLETALQLMYLYFTDPRFDEDEYNQGIRQISAILPNLLSQPNFILQKELYKTLFDSPRHLFIDEDVLAKANLATIECNYRRLFADAAGAVVTVVGDFDIDEVKPLIEKYIGSLPKGKKASSWIDRKDDIREGEIVNDFKAAMQTPKVTVAQIYTIYAPYSVQKAVDCSALNYILQMIYTDTLREEEGGTYGASTNAAASRKPDQATLQVVFETNPEQADALRALAIKGLKELAENGPSAEFFDRTVKNFEKTLPERRINNGYWSSSLSKYAEYGINYDAEYEAAIKALTPERVKAIAAEFLASGNFIELVMRPEAQ